MVKSLLTCTKCGQNYADCECPDADERLKTLAMDPSAPISFKWCRVCDKHYARCGCPTPDFYVILGGKEVPVPPGGFQAMDGRTVVPDLKRR